MRKILVVQVAALGWNLFDNFGDAASSANIDYSACDAAFPAVTCSAQAVFRTGLQAGETGVVFNGFYSKDTRKPVFWEQSSALCKGERIWEKFRARGGSVGMFFWQQSLGESVDYLLSPAPIHKHGGGMVDAVYSKPENLYDDLCRATGRKFKLHSYWGPIASAASSEYIAAATAEALRIQDAPELVFTYLPHLDYALQKYGPDSPEALASFSKTLGLLDGLAASSKEVGYDFLFWGDYAIGRAEGVALPNVALRKAGLMKTRNIRGRLYPDFYQSRAFAVVDHEIAHVYVPDPADVDLARKVLEDNSNGWYRVMKKVNGDPNDVGGELLLLGKPGVWFAYPWWENKKRAPDYASHIDIHNKPGYDPCELFWGIPPFTVSSNVTKIKGTHGNVGDGRRVAWSSSLQFDNAPESIIDLSRNLKDILDNG